MEIQSSKHLFHTFLLKIYTKTALYMFRTTIQQDYTGLFHSTRHTFRHKFAGLKAFETEIAFVQKKVIQVKFIIF